VFRLPATQDKNWSELTASKANTYRTILRHNRLIIIDEISMVGSLQLQQINARLQQLFGSQEIFGNKSVIVVGHLRQLPPVLGSHVFLPCPNFEGHRSEVASLFGNNLWPNFQFYELDEIMRQRGQHAFCQALNNMADGVMTPADIQLIKTREIGPNLTPPIDAIWLFYTNKECQEYNSRLHATLNTDGAWAVSHDTVKGNYYYMYFIGTFAKQYKQLLKN